MSEEIWMILRKRGEETICISMSYHSLVFLDASESRQEKWTFWYFIRENSDFHSRITFVTEKMRS